MDLRNFYRAHLFLLALAAGMAFSEPAPEYQLKSAFIYNFATFIEWPQGRGDLLTLCVAAPQDAMKYFTLLEGKHVGKLALTVRHLSEGDSATACRILFVADADNAGFDKWLPEIARQQVLTMSESESLLKKGAMVDLVLQEGRVVFDVNMDAAREEGIALNSKLLRLARKVYGLESPDRPSDSNPADAQTSRQ